jgi:protein-S-isoprenylcysteine O-methyltransferase Ste14
MALLHELRTQGNWLFRYRGTLPILILIPALLVFANEVAKGWPFEFAYWEHVKYFGLIVCLLGLGIRIHAVGHAAKNTSGRNTADGQVADELNSTGMYSVVRHPLYLGNFFMWLGPAIWTLNLWFILFFIAAYWLYYERIMYAEEAYLRDKFADKYDDWAKVRPAFIPKSSGFVKAKYPMNWRKILRQEKNGFAAIFIVLALFEVLGSVIFHRGLSLEWNFWTIAAVVSIVIYFILKFLKRSPILRDR